MSIIEGLKIQRDNMLKEARALLERAEVVSRRITSEERLASIDTEDEEFEDSWDSSWEDSGC